MTGPATLPTPFPTVVHMLEKAARDAPGKEALVAGTERLNYPHYRRAALAFAAELEKLGARGGRVALLAGNGVDTAIAWFGVLAAGAELVPLNPAYTAHELHFILADAAPRVLVHEIDPAIASDLAARCGIAHVVPLGAARRLIDPGRIGLGLPPAMPGPAATALVQYTGGTTGRPKGVMLSHRALATNVAQREALLPTKPDDRVLVMTPMFHSYASAMGLLLAAGACATLVIVPRFKPDVVMDLVTRERITLFAGSPTIFNALLAHPDLAATDWSSLRLTYSGSAALPAETLRRWEAATGAAICEGYGQTEAGPVLTYNPGRGVRKAGTVGPALPSTEVEIVDVETGTRVLPQGETGEVRARGPQIMTGYLNRPEETAMALRDGWLYTGDIGSLDADGYLTIRDRKKEMVIVAGFNVFPREVEDALYAYDGVAEAAVVGRPDAYRGETLVGYVVAMPGAAIDPDAVRAHLAGRLVAYKIPPTIVLVSDLPRTSVGKIDKVALKIWADGGETAVRQRTP